MVDVCARRIFTMLPQPAIVHHLLDRPRNRPVRSAIGAGALTFFVVLFVAGAQDVIAQKLSLSIPTVTNALRGLAVGLPAVVALFTWKLCRDLSAHDRKTA